MGSWQERWRRWWRQKALIGAHRHWNRDLRWGVNHATVTFLGDLIGPLIAARYSGQTLKSISAALHTRTIDELVSDWTILARTLESRGYVDERLLYVSPERRTLHTYLTHRTGRALTPIETWKPFHETILNTLLTLDLLVNDEDELNDRAYYLRRYGSVFTETYQVYSLYATLVGLTLPPLSMPT